ncbi:armadillo-like helical domain containing protein 1 isoform X4 [Hydra vulgaris]|uniref:Armadillo-like helical domain containing protein 1 isoform X4 n=1 Tax=Hydra vulgaris TaxID=6087 RepID=A0ABM4B530_HYDVU
MNLNELCQYLNAWDNSSTKSRLTILKTLIDEYKGKTSSELEVAFANVPKLFFTRLLSWWKVSYLTCSSPCVQLKAISVFVCAYGGNIFFVDFIDIGGINMLLEILSLNNEERKIESLNLLMVIANNGLKYKEIICKNHGLQILAGCLQASTNQNCQVGCHALLQDIATTCSKYEKKIFKTMVSLLKSTSTDAQFTAAQIIQNMQPSQVQKTVINPCIALLGSINLKVQYETCNLVKFLVSIENIQDDILFSIISVLKSGIETTDGSINSLLLVQLAAAAKIIVVIAKDTKIAEKLLALGCINILLNVLNYKHFEGRNHVVEALKNFKDVKTKQTFDTIGDRVFSIEKASILKHL